jgi:hypothetical protein
MSGLPTASAVAIVMLAASPRQPPSQQPIGTIWYVGDYLRKNAVNYSSRIGAFRGPGCQGTR